LPAVTTAPAAVDTEGVDAASKPFYAALSVLDDGAAIFKVWAHVPYATLVGPRSHSVVVGWDAINADWPESNKRFSKRTTTLLDRHVHVYGSLAWEMGRESGSWVAADGSEKFNWFVTNVCEKIGGHWLIVSHHV
jgi:hypothetical protein